MRRQWIQFREEFKQVLRRHESDTWQYDSEELGAENAHPVVGSVSTRRSTNCKFLLSNLILQLIWSCSKKTALGSSLETLEF